MQQLSGLDASFLAFETAHSTGYVGGPRSWISLTLAGPGRSVAI